MNQTIMVSNLIILSNSLNSDGTSGDLFPHAWALLIWFTVSMVVFVLAAYPWMEWGDQLYENPTSDWMIVQNATYRRKRMILLGVSLAISIVTAGVTLYLGL